MSKQTVVKTVEEKYKKYELLEHIQSLPDTYIGSTELTKIKTYIYCDESKKMVEKEITYIPTVKYIQAPSLVFLLLVSLSPTIIKLPEIHTNVLWANKLWAYMQLIMTNVWTKLPMS